MSLESRLSQLGKTTHLFDVFGLADESVGLPGRVLAVGDEAAIEPFEHRVVDRHYASLEDVALRCRLVEHLLHLELQAPGDYLALSPPTSLSSCSVISPQSSYLIFMPPCFVVGGRSRQYTFISE